MRVLPTEQIYRPVAYANRSERPAPVVDAVASGVSLGRALVPTGDRPFFRRTIEASPYAATSWLAHAIGQSSAHEAAEPAVAVAAYERADSMVDLAIRPQLPGARVTV